MYAVYMKDGTKAPDFRLQGTCIHDSTSTNRNLKLINPVLNMEENCAGSFTFKIPPTHPAYDSLELLRTFIAVWEDGEWIWEGRVFSVQLDYWNVKKVTVEGELAYLNDGVMGQRAPTSFTPSQGLETVVKDRLFTICNSNASNTGVRRSMYMGEVTVTDPNGFTPYTTDYNAPYEALQDLLETYGGHLRIRHNDAEPLRWRLLDYLADYPYTSNQVINFGENLQDINRSWDATTIITSIIPLGKALDQDGGSDYSSLTRYLDVSSINGSKYMDNSDLLAKYGRIIEVMHFDDIDDANLLYQVGLLYVNALTDAPMQIEVTAADLHKLNPTLEPFRLLTQIRCVSEPHNLDAYFPITKLEIYLDEPERSLVTLGGTSQMTISQATSKNGADIIKRSEQAQNNAVQMASSN